MKAGWYGFFGIDYLFVAQCHTDIVLSHKHVEILNCDVVELQTDERVETVI